MKGPALRGLAAGLVLAVALRALLPTLYYQSLVTLRLNATSLWVLVLLAPVLAPLLGRARWALPLSALAAAALPLARFTPWFVPLAALSAAAASVAVLRAGAPGALAGLAVHAALLLAGRGADPLLTGPGALLLLALAAATLRRPAEDAEAEGAPRVAAGLALGALVAVEVAFLASPYMVARHLAIPPWAATLAAAGGLAAGALAPRRAHAWLLAAGALGLADVAWLRSPLAPLSLALAQAALAHEAARLGRPQGAAFALALAPLAFVLLYFERPLGVPEWGLLVPALAAAALLAGPRRPRAPRAPARLPALLVLAVLLAGTLLPSAPAPPPERDELVVVTWNVRQGFGNRGGPDADLYADALRALEPDIVLLQETGSGRLSSGGLDMAQRLAHELGMNAAYADSALAVLSRFPLVEADGLLHAPWSHEAGLDVDGRTVWVHSVHLARSSQERLAQARQVLAAADARPGLRILGGDVNSCPAATCFGGRPSDGVHGVLAERYQDAWRAAHGDEDPSGFTHPSRAPSRRIDVVMVTGFEVVDAAPVRDARTVLGSDHLPVVARLRVT